MSDIIVYGVPGSPFVRSVQMGLEEKGAAYRLQAIGAQELKGEAHLKRHPFGRVPAFEHGDFRLYETQAILRYLDDVFPEPALEPADPRAAARMNQIIGINDWYFFPKVAAVIVGQRIVGPALLGMTTDEAVVAAAVPPGRVCIAELDRLLGLAALPGRGPAVDRGPDAGAADRFPRGDAGRKNHARGHRTRGLARAHERAAQHDCDPAAASRCAAPREMTAWPETLPAGMC